MKNKCAFCGEEYEYEPKRGTFKFKFCSVKCRNAFSKKEKEPHYRTCEQCGKEYWWSPDINYNGAFYVDSKRFCCFECGKQYKYGKIKQSYIKHNGAMGFASKKIREKIDDIKEKKYGDRHFNNVKQRKATNLKKYGVEHCMWNDKVRKKCSDIWKNKSDEEKQEISEKRKKTCIKKYGVEVPAQSKEIQNKIEKTNLERYGVKSPAKSEKVKTKMKRTNLKNMV